MEVRSLFLPCSTGTAMAAVAAGQWGKTERGLVQTGVLCEWVRHSCYRLCGIAIEKLPPFFYNSPIFFSAF
jgi:hypothetical protein